MPVHLSSPGSEAGPSMRSSVPTGRPQACLRQLPDFDVPLALAQAEVTFQDPADGPDRHAKLDDFLAVWATAGYGGVRVWIPRWIPLGPRLTHTRIW
jgi:hypothetical protein